MKKREAEEKNREKERKLATNARDYYAEMTNLYSRFDNEGVPTHNIDGSEIKKVIIAFNCFRKLEIR